MTNTDRGAPPPRHRTTLTPRQLEILAMQCEGLNGPAIAKRLGVTVGTIHITCGAARRRVGVQTHNELVEHAYSQGWLPIRPRTPGEDEVAYLNQMYVPFFAMVKNLQADFDRIVRKHEATTDSE